MIEVALVFDRSGRAISWHLPPGASAASLPDSRSLWEVLWQHRDQLGGVAHIHPWSGGAGPSRTDLTTWSACERGLGLRLVWPVVSFTEVAYFSWNGPEDLDYDRQQQPTVTLRPEDLEELRRRSRKEGSNER